MSPSWNESLRVALAPEQVGLVRMNRGWRPRMLEGKVQPCAIAADEPPWAGALAALAEGLAGLNAPDGKRPGGDIAVVLSNHFVRYLLVPQNPALAGEAEALAHAGHCFAKVYGGLAEAWDVRLNSAHDGPQVACAIDAELLAGLDRAAQACGRRLVSVQPYLMAAFNRWRKTFSEPLVWFVLAEPGRLCLAALDRGCWRQLLNLQSDGAWARRLPELLARQRKLAGLDEQPGKVYLFAPDEEAAQILQDQGEQVQGLHLSPLREPALPPAEAACYAMALNG